MRSVTGFGLWIKLFNVHVGGQKFNRVIMLATSGFVSILAEINDNVFLSRSLGTRSLTLTSSINEMGTPLLCMYSITS